MVIYNSDASQVIKTIDRTVESTLKLSKRLSLRALISKVAKPQGFCRRLYQDELNRPVFIQSSIKFSHLTRPYLCFFKRQHFETGPLC